MRALFKFGGGGSYLTKIVSICFLYQSLVIENICALIAIIRDSIYVLPLFTNKKVPKRKILYFFIQ